MSHISTLFCLQATLKETDGKGNIKAGEGIEAEANRDG